MEKFRILYLASPARAQAIQKDLQILNQFHASIVFYSDAFELVKDIAALDADFVFVDERPVEQENTDLHCSFEQFENAFRFQSLHLHYTMRRVLVVISKSAEKSGRAFQVGLSNVRGVIVDPENAEDLFAHSISLLMEFQHSHNRSSLCVSGGGLEGYLYSLGVSKALDSCFVDKQTTDFDIFCGVSSGAILSACHAAGLSSRDLVDQVNQRHSVLENMKISMLFDPAAGEVFKRIWGFAKSFSFLSMATLDTSQLISNLQAMIPIGLFRGDKLKSFFEKQMTAMGVQDHFFALKKELYISATDQDSGESVLFGEEPWKDLKISQAVRASTALPAFYLPEKINGHWFTDGQLTSSSDFQTAIRKGAGLVIYIDPMVAYSSTMAGATMSYGGYFTLIQAVKSLVQSRSVSLLRHAMDTHPDVDFLVFRPTDDVMLEMAGNPMKSQIRTELVDLGFQCTIGQILNSYDLMVYRFSKHGFFLKSKEDIKTYFSANCRKWGSEE